MKQANKIINFPIFWKFAFVSIVVVVIYGSINIYMLWNSVYNSFEKEIDKRSNILAQIVAEKALEPIVYGNNVSLYSILDEIKYSDPTISYIFILDNSNKIVAQTYDIIIPNTLIFANELDGNSKNIKEIETVNFKSKIIRDIAYPILNGDVGVVRLGISEDHVHAKLIEITRELIVMIIAFLIFGLIGALFFSYIITTPISKISKMAQIIDINNLKSENYEITSKNQSKFFNIEISDELDDLVTKFSEMLKRLKTNYIELKKTESALVQAERLASLGTLSAGVAHEINNPISGIQNCVNRILKNPDNKEQNIKYIALIKEATDKIENVVQHLLKFSRKQKMTFTKTSLNTVIENAISLTNHEIKKNQISVNFDTRKKWFINGSSNHLEQVIVNLLLNSMDAIIEKKVDIEGFKGKISIFLKSNNKKVEIHFKDNGNGIPLDIQKKIFDPFFTSKKVGKGTGLGLSVSFDLIKKHNGHIYFKSNVSQGTKFIIELPKNSIV